jgi:hypothetical protein
MRWTPPRSTREPACARRTLANLMLRIPFAAAFAFSLVCANASAQSGSSPRQLCDTLLKPAYENIDDYKKQSLTADCACVTGFLIGRYGAEDGRALIQLFSVFASGSEEKVKVALLELGEPKIRALDSEDRQIPGCRS